MKKLILIIFLLMNVIVFSQKNEIQPDFIPEGWQLFEYDDIDFENKPNFFTDKYLKEGKLGLYYSIDLTGDNINEYIYILKHIENKNQYGIFIFSDERNEKYYDKNYKEMYRNVFYDNKETDLSKSKININEFYLGVAPSGKYISPYDENQNRFDKFATFLIGIYETDASISYIYDEKRKTFIKIR